jgi:hypothetical protein
LAKDEAVSKILHSYHDRMVNLQSNFTDRYPPAINKGRTIASKWLDFDQCETSVKDQIIAEIDDMYCFVGMSSSTLLAFI